MAINSVAPIENRMIAVLYCAYTRTSGHGISAFRSGSIIIMKQTIGEIPYDDQLCMGA